MCVVIVDISLSQYQTQHIYTWLYDIVLTHTQYFAGGAGAEGEIAKYLEKNRTLVKLGYNFQVPSFRTKVDGFIMRNNDIGEYIAGQTGGRY